MQRYRVAFWNLENLFAPEGHPKREPWIEDAVGRDLRGWTEDLFARKIAQLASLIARMDEGRGPDLLGVCEVENRFCLEALAADLNGRLPGRCYGLVHADAEKDRRGIDTAFLFDEGRLESVPGEVFSHFVMRRTGTRDVTQATFRTASGNELVVMANHWPSRSGGRHETAGFRATAGETVGYWHERVREVKGAGVALLAFGDFNDEPFDPSLTRHANATRERGDVLRARSARFYNPSWRFLDFNAVDADGAARAVHGTHYYQNDGGALDQILAARGLLLDDAPLRLAEETVGVEAFPEHVEARAAPAPRRFGLPKGAPERNVDPDGYSDHYPVGATVEEG